MANSRTGPDYLDRKSKKKTPKKKTPKKKTEIAGLLDGNRETLIRRLENLSSPKQHNYGTPANQKAIDAIRAKLKTV